jgi:hypothetical protein
MDYENVGASRRGVREVSISPHPHLEGFPLALELAVPHSDLIPAEALVSLHYQPVKRKRGKGQQRGVGEGWERGRRRRGG